jgi:hypothetical protein
MLYVEEVDEKQAINGVAISIVITIQIGKEIGKE